MATNIQFFCDCLNLANSIEDEEIIFANAQEALSTDEYSRFTAVAPISKFLDDPEFNR